MAYKKNILVRDIRLSCGSYLFDVVETFRGGAHRLFFVRYTIFFRMRRESYDE